ncbi:MAG: phosphomannomutase [Gammaproteobacteria bacterium]|nr:phosphomannomutase [Gammaproteobacteria bacterium]
MSSSLTCFKAYDIRGRVPDELNEDIAYRIGRAYAAFVKPDTVVVGRDIRHSSPQLAAAVSRGLQDMDVDVLDIGVGGTEQVYFSTWHLGASGGIMVTASHNPADYNGMKFVRAGARPISGDTGLDEIRRLSEQGFAGGSGSGDYQSVDTLRDYLDHLLGYTDAAAVRPLKIVVNPGNGGAGLVIDALAASLPYDFIKVHFAPDGSFPHGVPNPLLPENRTATIEAIRESGADLGVAWDGDFDRCFLFDEQGAFVEGYYIVGLLARTLLERQAGGKIVHDPRLTWNTIDVVNALGGVPVQCKTGHAFIKERMRAEDALYGGEMSAHHYFRDFAYCDSGMIPWLLVADIMSRTGKPLSALVSERIARYPVSGEINRRVTDPAEALARVRARYEANALRVDETDGISLEFDKWRFNLRLSNTEPVIRLNVEARADQALMQARTAEILALLDE